MDHIKNHRKDFKWFHRSLPSQVLNKSWIAFKTKAARERQTEISSCSMTGRVKMSQKSCVWKCLPFSYLLLSCDIISHMGHQSCSVLTTHPAYESFSSFFPVSTRHAAQNLLQHGCAGAWADLPALALWSQLPEQIAVRLGLDLARLESGSGAAWCMHKHSSSCSSLFTPIGPWVYGKKVFHHISADS